MNQLTAHQEEYSTKGRDLYVAFELGKGKWKMGFTVGLGQRPRERTIGAGDLGAIKGEIDQAKRRFGLAEGCRVLSCYEAGRDGFWLHRVLDELGVVNVVVDSSSIEVNRRARRAKTDGMDVRKLLGMLVRYYHGEGRVWRVVSVPTVEQEDSRQLHRELGALKGERNRHINRIKGVLAGCGVRMGMGRAFLERLDRVRMWDGQALPMGLRRRVVREYERLKMVEDQIKAVVDERSHELKTSRSLEIEKVRQLITLRGIGVNSGWLYVMEFFGWREFRTGKQIGALAGLTPTPYQSGDRCREQGISRAGNRYVRPMIIQIAWAWLRYQPHSKLSRWYQERFGHGGSRLRRIGIVALARRLLIDLWRFLETGVIPEGALLKG
jgi:transposase